MRNIIRNLVQLQEIAFEIRDLESKCAAAPGLLSELDTLFQQKREEIGAARLTHEALVQRKKEFDEEREVAALRLDKAQKKLMTVSNQREYSAVLNEIDGTKTLLGQLDRNISECDGQIEELSGPAAEADTHIAAEKEKIDSEKSQITDTVSFAETRLAELSTMREQIVRELPPGDVRRFDAVFKARAGVAMAAVANGACSACHVRLRPQVISLVRREAELVSCDSCRRLLFIQPPEPEVATDPQALPEPSPQTEPPKQVN